jgi:translation elongation factor EF-G
MRESEGLHLWKHVPNRRVNIREDEIPAEILDFANEKRRVLIETLADVDDVIADRYLMEEEPTMQELQVLSFIQR